MDLQLKVPRQLIESIEKYLQSNSLANRGHGDGTKTNQRTGLICEAAVQHYLTGEYPDFEAKANGFDGGYDLVYNGKKIDVKGKGRKSSDMRPFWDINLYVSQQNYPADILVFCSYNYVAGDVVTICGWIEKEDFLKYAYVRTKKDTNTRTDGTLWGYNAAQYEQKVTILHPIETLLTYNQSSTGEDGTEYKYE